MKSATVKMLTLAVLAATMFVSAAFAQQQGTQYKAAIPFEFQLAGKVLPAGNYIVKLTDHFVQIRNTDTNQGVGIATLRSERKQTAEKDTLQFNVYGKQYFLANVWFQGDYVGRELIRSKAEIEMAKKGSESHVQLALKK